MKALIIDDERKARSVLRIVIEENCPSITQINEADDLLSGIALIKEKQPDLVFLDIEMPEYFGLEIFDFLERDAYTFQLVFVTAHDEYALEAFKLNAVDYILKPTKPCQLIAAVDKAIGQMGNTQMVQKLDELKKSFKQPQFKKVALPYDTGIKFVNFDELVLLEADGMYTKITTTHKKSWTVSKPLKHFSELLYNQKIFFKPHRSFLINLNHIGEYIKKDGGYIVMDNGQTVSLSPLKKEDFLALIAQL
ncbi:MAG: LytTR family DNA-binding domain-containing protein [Flavobacteriaceae bacterium]|nr:LytTR family DNA-binding domain-containing protein [Flavobacteriaceae bacterium]